MTTSSSECRAQDPAHCRYHSAESADWVQRATNRYHELEEQLNRTELLEERYSQEQNFRQVQLEYASTDAGQQYFINARQNTDDWTEQERYSQLLEEGLRLRHIIESRRSGITTFPASQLPEALNRIDIANRKLQRAGIEEQFTYSIEHYVETNENMQSFNMVKLTLNRPEFHIGGWAFVAAVDKADNGSIITRPYPGQELDGERPNEFICEHCGSNRRRNTTYLLKNRTNGEYKQVGSNCLEAFTAVKPRGLWALNYDPEENDNLLDNGQRSWGGQDSLLPTREIVAAALAVSNNGARYVSKNQEQNTNEISTASQVKSYFFSQNNSSEDRPNHHDYMVAAERMISDTRFEGNQDYATNMRALLANENTSYKHIGYVTSVIAAAQRQQRQEQRASQQQTPQATGYLGQPGERLRNLTVTVTQRRIISGDHGDRTLLVFTDPDGKELKWWASGVQNHHEGDKLVLVAATVKQHEEYRGNQQTVITRAKILDD